MIKLPNYIKAALKLLKYAFYTFHAEVYGHTIMLFSVLIIQKTIVFNLSIVVLNGRI